MVSLRIGIMDIADVNESPQQSAMQSEIGALLISGRANTMAEAEQMYLDAHLSDIVALAEQLPDEEFRRHELARLLLAHGSRPLEDSLE